MGDENRSRATLAGKAAQKPGKRSGVRTPICVELEVEGANGLFTGLTVDLSPTGALIWLNDDYFKRHATSRHLVQFGEKVEQEFSEGMRVRVAGGGVFHEADVVRVAHREDKPDPLLLACHFLTPLSKEECKRVGIDPDTTHEMVVQVVPVQAPAEPEEAAPAIDDARLPPPSEAPRPPVQVRRDRGQTSLERREAPRVDRVLVADVEGDFDAYKAHVLNLSYAGALITLTDPAFAPPGEPGKLVLFTKRLGLQFGNGLVLRLLESDVSVKADVVRVNERTEGGARLVVIGCKFRRNLTTEECKRLEIEAPPSADAEPARESPYFEKTRIRDLMVQAMQSGATDLHIKVASIPRMRRGGGLVALGREPVRTEEAHAMALELMTREQAAHFEREGDVELAYTIEGVGRFRVNILRQRGMTGLALRCIPSEIPTLASLGLSPLAKVLAEKPRGLVLVTGPTGSGKSTTLAAIINHINRTRACHVITMEDPIEYIHTDIEAHVTQREIGRDALDFSMALKRALRQDPDVIMVGEMRDLETISLALTAAETGHLVFATLHTTSAALTPDRIVDVFPPNQQTQIRLQLADSLQGIMAQMLLPRIDGGMVLAQEILVATDAVRALIRERKTPQVLNMMQTGAKEGMQTLEGALNELVRKNIISFETACSRANFPRQIRRKGD